MFEVDPASGDTHRVSSLEAYLYDIGPNPYFFFKAEVEQLAGGSLNAGKTELIVERYVLLKAHEASVYKGLDNEYPDIDASPAWAYHGPVELSFSKSVASEAKVVFTSEPEQISFLDPENPVTFARPMDYKIVGFAYRFILLPASIHQHDKNPSDNTYQLTFLKP